MFEKILIFILFLGPLIFFHELGHFLFARLFGVRVEVFSIGFGPKIFKYIKNGTEYAISAIPLGGYVKMFGDDPFSDVQLSEEEKKVAFNHKSKWARFWIVFGGPLANLILAYFLYVGLMTVGEKVPETKVGFVHESSILYEKGLRTGDVLVGINDEKITSFDDLNIKGSEVEILKVNRLGRTESIKIGMPIEPFIGEFIKLSPAIKKPIFLNAKIERYFLSKEPKPVRFDISLEEILNLNPQKIYLYRISSSSSEEISLDFSSEIAFEIKSGDLISHLKGLGFYSVDLSIRNVVMGSPADKVGLRKDDILLTVNGVELTRFEDLRNILQDSKDSEFEISFLSSNTTVSKKITPEIKEIENKKVKLIGVESAVEYISPKLVEIKADSLFSALISGVERTWDGVVKTFSGYKKLITREVSLNNIGGPLAIGKVASDSFNVSLSMFFRLMAIISINLGVINLFPIPVLDGGHIMFLFFEMINRGPLSRRKLEIAQRFGMSLLFFLIFVALFNDFSRLF
jgi:regulator of sigma E protease